jgi:hypothetical protein
MLELNQARLPPVTPFYSAQLPALSRSWVASHSYCCRLASPADLSICGRCCHQQKMPVANLCNQLIVKRAPDDSTVFPSRSLTFPSTGTLHFASATAPKRRFSDEIVRAGAGSPQSGAPASSARAVDAARVSCSR